jgi:hypothetical protein
MIEGFIVDHGSPAARDADARETADILADIHRQFVKEGVQVPILPKVTNNCNLQILHLCYFLST